MSFKLKISVVSFVLVAALTGLVLLLAVEPFGASASQQVDDAVARASKLAQRSQRLHAYDLVAQAKRIAVRKEFADALRETETKMMRAAVFDSINQLDKQLAQEGRKPGFLGVVDAQGAIIARDLDPNANYGEKLPYPQVMRTLKTGAAQSAVWMEGNRMMRAAMAPIHLDGAIKGAVILAYQITAAEARQDYAQFGAHVAYFMENSLRASSLTVAGDPTAEDGQAVAALNRALARGAAKPFTAAEVSKTTSVTIGGETFRMVAGPLHAAVAVASDATGSGELALKPIKGVGFVVLASSDAALQPVRRARMVVLGFGVLVFVVLLVGLWTVARHFIGAEDHLELGVNEVINGNLDYTFEVLDEFEGLANALNVMLARLLGRPEPGEEEEGDASWRADLVFVEDLGPGPEEAELARQLAAEPEEQYYARLFQQYIEARKQANLPVDGISLESLTQKLKANEAMLRARHKCQMVRFVVNAVAGKVSFKPVRIG
ncbi:MAG: hypothetical protein H6707_16180 [Deltaproteobacteria bacterium]|nr:hypothetical protein [Deltaproteobacteria bacterium]